MNHYRTVVEIPDSKEVFHEVDHSPFFSSGETEINNWVDLDDDEIADLNIDREPTMNKLFLRAYEEKEIGSIKSISYLTIKKLDDDKAVIVFDLLMPDLEKSPIIYSEVIIDSKQQSMAVDKISFYEGCSYPETDSKIYYNPPKEIQETLKQYNEEVLKLIQKFN